MSRIEVAKANADFFDVGYHFAALALLASAYLSEGSPSAAFAFADRRCRIIHPGVEEFMLRAEASRLAGYLEFAEADLAAALKIDPTDDLINYGALKWGPRTGRAAAAERLISSGNASPGALAQALEALMDEGARAVHSLERRGEDIEGWLAWQGAGPLELRAHGPAGTKVHIVERDDRHPLTSGRISMASVKWPDAILRSVDLALDGQIVARAPAPPVRAISPTRARKVRGELGANAPSLVTVIVPVYEDLEATRACLASLTAQKSKIAFRIIVVDDRTPNGELRDFVERAARRDEFLLIQNEWNLGFAGAVNEAFLHCLDGDVLLLNSDTFLPVDAIERLVAAAYSSPEIGTVTPFSNNGELTSYPAPNVANPIDSAARILEIDRCAAAANRAGVVDLPNGVGFCLYIKRSCLDTVGPLSETYSRGYCEDVEFCLKARELGFRNVCATGVFVGHAGTRSFGSDKRALVVRNLAILATRFPEYEIRYAAFLQADPLRPARSAIDKLLVPTGDVVLLASGQGASKFLAQMRARDRVALEVGETLIHIIVRGADRVELVGYGSAAPRSLSFSVSEPSGLAEMGLYLSRCEKLRLEIFDASALPGAMLEELLGLGARVELICADLEWFRGALNSFDGPCRDLETGRPCDECNANFLETPVRPEDTTDWRARLGDALNHADAVTPIDRMGEAFARQVFKDKATPLDRGGKGAIRSPAIRPAESTALGLLAPVPLAAIDRLVLRLGRLFARLQIETPIVVLGRCVDDLGLMATGNVFVTGPVQANEYERLVAQYEIGALVLPHRTAFFGVLDDLARAVAIPKAYFDWSFGALAAEGEDLSLDPRICDEKTASSLADWVRALYRKETR
jgi:GT2 family glycosyltransferase